MLPLKLELKNFMSYGLKVQPVDFAELNLVVLSGENGVGKSSLLEAITWAVWGKARVASDNDLIRIGQIEMEVIFDFEVDEEKYRIIRKRQRKSRGGATILEFQGLKADEYISLTEPTIKDTQEKIINTIKLSYETFVNSAFIRQGHADEFTGKKAADRKAILGEILGLYLYDELAQKAKEKVRIFESTASSLNLYIEQIEGQLKARADLEEQSQKLEPDFKKAETELKKLEQQQADLQAKVALLESLKSQATKLSAETKELSDEEAALASKHKDLQAKISTAKQVLAGKELLEKAFRELKEIEKKIEILRGKKEKLNLIAKKRQEAEDRKSKLLHAFEVRQKELESKRELLKNQIKAAEQISFDLQKVKKQLAELKTLSQNKDSLDAKIDERKTKLNSLQAAWEKLKAEGKDLKQKQEDAKKLKGDCPTCHQKISAEHLEKVLENYEAELQQKRLQYQKQEIELQKMGKELENLLQKAADLKQEILEAEKWQREEGRLQGELQEVKQKKLLLNAIKDELAKLQTEQKNNAELLELGAELHKLKAEEKIQVYDESEHSKLEKKLKENESLHEKRAALERAQSQEELYEQNLKELDERQLANQAKQQKVKLELESTLLKLAELKDFEKEFAEQQDLLTESKKAYQRLQSERSAILEKLKHLENLARDLAEKKKNIEGSLKDKSLYEELAVAFGKKGVQAMIIESVVPEIEIETNEILGRMTDNQMQVKFELQKPKKASEGTIETLEIMVADSVGTRNYELFSGGEAFRINFAIRVALSKLLARRAGARLQLLVIDEGFGSQDQIGRDHLVSAINSIKDDFAKIMVVTHIEELKDAFPQRIEVRKGDEGSTLKVA
ncbi:MAG: SMC family ATPase [Candidatus Gracilibacteria bacterium]|nr:SMC family ATPase [Candidatus Gracilibacteria bacterium]